MSPRSTDLDESVTAAVIENNRSVRGGDFHTEDHVILKTVVDGRATTVYCIAFYLEYNNEGELHPKPRAGKDYVLQ